GTQPARTTGEPVPHNPGLVGSRARCSGQTVRPAFGRRSVITGHACENSSPRTEEHREILRENHLGLDPADQRPLRGRATAPADRCPSPIGRAIRLVAVPGHPTTRHHSGLTGFLHHEVGVVTLDYGLYLGRLVPLDHREMARMLPNVTVLIA